MSSGTYQIVCKTNGRRYIGSSKNIEGRWKEHLRCLKKGTHTAPHLQNCFNKYGETDFHWGIINICNVDELLVKEQKWLDVTPSLLNGHLSATGRGAPHSEATRRKISETRLLRGIKHDDETKKLIGETGRGRKTSEQTKALLSERGKTGPKSAEHIQRMKDAWKNRETVSCPHCGKVGFVAGLTRWHFDKCKHA